MIVQVGGAIGGWWTAGLLVADSLLGAWLLRVEGRRAWQQFRTALQEGRWPGDEVAQGALIIVGGTLLLTPGFLTDALGFLFLVAPTRRWVARRLRARVGGQVVGGGPAGTGTPSPGAGGDRGRSARTATDAGRSSRRPRSGADAGTPLELDVEVVEIRREQGPRAVTGRRSGDGAAADDRPEPAADDGPEPSDDDGPGGPGGSGRRRHGADGADPGGG